MELACSGPMICSSILRYLYKRSADVELSRTSHTVRVKIRELDSGATFKKGEMVIDKRDRVVLEQAEHEQ